MSGNSGRQVNREEKWEELNANVFTPYNPERTRARRKRVNQKIKETYLAYEPKFKACYKAMDKDGNGDINKTEFSQALGKAIRSMDPKASNKTIAETVSARWALLDKDGDKKVSYEEFWSLFTIEGVIPTCETWPETVAMADSFGVDLGEFEKYARDLVRSESNLNIKECYLGLKPQFESLFKKYDKDGSGKIDYSEFSQITKAMLMSRLQVFAEEEMNKECERRFKAIDTDNSQEITWVEFWTFFSSEEMVPDIVTWKSSVATLKSFGLDVSNFEDL